LSDIESEDTYSLIFLSLKHPIRRRILRMLTEEPMSFSRIQGALDIDSGHLSYHLENLGELLSRSPEGQYKLSSIGEAATKLMGGVEEKTFNDFSLFPKRKTLNGAFILFFALLIVALFFNSLFLTLTPQTDSHIMSGSYPQSIPLNGTLNYNLSIVYRTNSFETGYGSISHSGLGYFYILAEKPFQDLTHRTWDYIGFTLELNGTGSFRIRIYDSDNQLMWELLDPSLYIKRVLSMNESGNSFSGITKTMQYIPGETFNIAPRSKPGTYKISIEWIKTDQVYEALIKFEHVREWVKWSFFYNGFVGIHLSTLFPIIIITLWVRTKPETVKGKKRKIA